MKKNNPGRGMFETVGIIGGGVMGTGLARHFLVQGLRVIIVEAEDHLAEGVRKRLDASFQKEVERGKVGKDLAAGYMASLRVGSDLSSLSEAGFIIEAIIEDLAAKRSTLKDAESAAPLDALMSTNTSALPVSALASVLKRPESFLGTHFFNPAHVMRLVEVVPGFDTSSETVDRTFEFLQSTGKTPVLVKECPGFLVNRILGAYMNEALWILGESTGIREIEEIAKDLGLPMGPVTLGEMAGWDVICTANETLERYYGQRFRIPPLLKRLAVEGRHGIKSGKGLLDHSVHPPAPTDDFVPSSKTLREKGREGLEKRLLYSIFSESLRCLDENVCRAQDIDAAMVLGAGLPKGPLTWADEAGLDKVLDQLQQFEIQLGSRFQPSPILHIAVMAGYTGKSAGRGLAGLYADPSL